MSNYSTVIKDLQSNKAFQKLPKRDFSDTSLSTHGCNPGAPPPQPLHSKQPSPVDQQSRKISVGNAIYESIYDEEAAQKFDTASKWRICMV